MKQPLIVAGGRRWHGDEMVNFHTDAVNAAEAVAQSAGNCVLAGVTISGGGPYTVSAGVVGINHADGYKICRFAGGTVTAFPAYLVVTKNITTKVYDDLNLHNAQAEYVATLVTSLPATPYLQINATGAKPFAQALVEPASVIQTVSTTLLGGALNCSVVLNNAMRCISIRGSIVVTTSVSDPPLQYALFTLPAGFAPLVDHHFSAVIRYHSAYPPYDTVGQAFSNLSGSVFATGSVSLGLRRPSSGTYTAYINAMVPLW